jgi:N-acetylmuramoyl-L-alanine amidase
MKRFVWLTLLGMIALTAARAAPPEIYIAYPDPDYEVPFDRILLEGSVPAGAKLTVDGKAVDTGTDGLFIEYWPLKPGVNNLKLETTLGSEKSVKELKVTSSPDAPLPAAPTKIVEGSIEPATDSVYYVSTGQVIRVRFNGAPGGQASFKLGDKGPFKMLERNPADFVGAGDPKSEAALKATAGIYEGTYSVQSGDLLEAAAITVSLTGTDKQVVTVAAKGKLTLKNTQPRVGIYTSTPDVGIVNGREVARNGPGYAYVLLHLRPGMKFLITGEESTWYQARIAPGQNVYLRKDKMRLLPEGAPAPQHYFTTIRTKRANGGTQIRFELPDIAPFGIEQNSATAGQSLEVKLFSTESNVDYIVYANPDPLLKDIKWTQSENGVFTARIDLKTNQQWGYKASYEGNTLLLEIKDAPVIKRSKPLEGHKIAIDPGHGGEDSGAVGALRVNEKSFNLEISKKLAVALKAMGADVMMTRETDVEIDLYERSRMAEKFGAEILLSIHGNALPDGVDPAGSKGAGGYYFHPQARALAETILESLTKGVPGLGNDGVHYQNLALTRTTARPQVLVETAFLTNKDNLRLLMTDDGRQRIANGIAAGVELFYKNQLRR